MLFCFKLARIVRKLKLVRNSVRNSFFFSKLASQHSAQLSFCLEDKSWGKHRAHFSCCSKLASKYGAQLSFCLELSSLVKHFEICLYYVNFLSSVCSVRNVETSSNFPHLCKRVCASTNRQKLAPFNKNAKLCKTKCSTVKSFKLGCARNERSTFNLPILVFVVNNI